MKTRNWLLSMTALLLLVAVGVNAEEAETTAAKKAPVELKNQTHCPVMGGKIDSSAYTDIQGQRVYHCCPGCSNPLKADPDKFFKKAAADGILFENIQTACPICNMKLGEKAVEFSFEGRRIFACSEQCKIAFNKDAPKYLTMMDAPKKDVDNKETKSDKDADKGHEGHGH